jgi:hypothetical protein
MAQNVFRSERVGLWCDPFEIYTAGMACASGESRLVPTMKPGYAFEECVLDADRAGGKKSEARKGSLSGPIRASVRLRRVDAGLPNQWPQHQAAIARYQVPPAGGSRQKNIPVVDP